MRTSISARRLLRGERLMDYPLVTLEGGRIASIEERDAGTHARGTADHHFPEATLVPAFLDIHIHGCAGHDVMEATPQALQTIGNFLAARGVGAYLPTTVTSTREDTLHSLNGLTRFIAGITDGSSGETGATPLGIHLEGPFLSHIKRGVHRDSLLQTPSIPLFDRFWEAAEGRIRLMTIAPELPGAAELIAYASGLGVRCSLGHSNATASESRAGLTAGAASATHTFNAMRALDHREPGLAAFVLDQPSLFAEIICDGIHVDPMMVRLFLAAKGKDHIILVTDGISATGMPDGVYTLGGMQVEVQGQRCTSEGILAGSVLTMERAVCNLMEFTGVPLATAVNAASRNPSRLLGLTPGWGQVEEGEPAAIAVLAGDGRVSHTFLGGRSFVQ